jgi:AraC-like DNA-binding protein
MTQNIEPPLIPAAYMSHWIALLAARGIPAERVLAGSDLPLEAIADPKARITPEVLARLLQRGIELTGDRSLALELGLSLKPTSHGLLGYAMMCAQTLREACEIGTRYLGIRASPWRVHVFVEGDRAVMQFDEYLKLGAMRTLVLESLLGGVVRLGEFLLGHSFAHPEIEFCADYPEQPHHARFHARMPRVRYSCPKLQARFPAAWLDRPLRFAEPSTCREAVAVLDQELRLAESDDWVERTRALLADPDNGYPDLRDAAARLHVSTRTLRRRLHARGTTFHTLRDEARLARAITLLAQSPLSIDAIAHQLGFSDLTGFSRAFRRWAGQPPRVYRAAHRARAAR